MLILEDELFIELSTTSSMIDAFCLPGTAVVPLAHSTTGSSAEQKKSENTISVCKPLLLSLTSTIVFSIINKCYLTVNFPFLN